MEEIADNRIEYRRALNVALRVQKVLLPFSCNRWCVIGGSIRRESPLVKDIEIILSPLQVPAQATILGTVEKWRHMPELEAGIRKLGVIIKGDPSCGRYVKVDILNTSGDHVINADIFIPQHQDFWRQVMIRTGSADFSARMARTWVQKGWVGTYDGLRLKSECIEKGKHKWVCTKPNPTLPPAWKSEQEFFEWLGVNWVEPRDRQ